MNKRNNSYLLFKRRKLLKKIKTLSSLFIDNTVINSSDGYCQFYTILKEVPHGKDIEEAYHITITATKQKYYYCPEIADDFPLKGRKYYVELDPEIKDIVRSLNKKGYRTEMSCAGHIHEKLIQDGWISMTKENYKKFPRLFLDRLAKSGFKVERYKDKTGYFIAWKFKTLKARNKRLAVLKDLVGNL